MHFIRLTLIAALACATMLVADRASADPRGSLVAGAEPVPDTPMDVFLGRLVDKYKFEGSITTTAGEGGVRGTADCVAIGSGSGVQCILNVTWQEIWDIRFPGEALDSGPIGVFEVPGGIPYLDPAMALFGLDPQQRSFSYLLVNNKGMPEGGPGFVKGNRTTFKTRCVNEAALLAAMAPPDNAPAVIGPCERTIYMEAKPDSKVMWWNIDITIGDADTPATRFILTLRRQPREVQDGNPTNP